MPKTIFLTFLCLLYFNVSAQDNEKKERTLYLQFKFWPFILKGQPKTIDLSDETTEEIALTEYRPIKLENVLLPGIGFTFTNSDWVYDIGLRYKGEKLNNSACYEGFTKYHALDLNLRFYRQNILKKNWPFSIILGASLQNRYSNVYTGCYPHGPMSPTQPYTSSIVRKIGNFSMLMQLNPGLQYKYKNLRLQLWFNTTLLGFSSYVASYSTIEKNVAPSNIYSTWEERESVFHTPFTVISKGFLLNSIELRFGYNLSSINGKELKKKIFRDSSDKVTEVFISWLPAITDYNGGYTLDAPGFTEYSFHSLGVTVRKSAFGLGVSLGRSKWLHDFYVNGEIKNGAIRMPFSGSYRYGYMDFGYLPNRNFIWGKSKFKFGFAIGAGLRNSISRYIGTDVDNEQYIVQSKTHTNWLLAQLSPGLRFNYDRFSLKINLHVNLFGFCYYDQNNLYSTINPNNGDVIDQYSNYKNGWKYRRIKPFKYSSFRPGHSLEFRIGWNLRKSFKK